ncbi:MAG: hypothetical protein LBL06_00145 [Treponema sp.]|jgi:hypothetical protein|nr:hypothetical protein [Treponema sp.]
MTNDWSSCLDEIRKGITEKRFSSEAAVSQGIIIPLFDLLGWNSRDTQSVYPQFPLDSHKKVDYALCYRAGKPDVIIEVKAIGNTAGADEQLCNYAFKAGVPIAVLTDGQEWSFYYPAGRGPIFERRFYKINILKRDSKEIRTQMEAYLKYDNVRNGKAAKNAQEAYENTRSKEYIPNAFQKLIGDNDEILTNLISEKVADLCGIKPSIEDIKKYLKTLTSPTVPTNITDNKSTILPLVMTNNNDSANIQKGFNLNGSFTPKRTAIDVIISLFVKLEEKYPGFLEKFDQSEHNFGTKNRYISKNRNELYPHDSKKSQKSTKKLSSEYWIGTNISNETKEKLAKSAAKVLGLTYGKDVYIQI